MHFLFFFFFFVVVVFFFSASTLDDGLFFAGYWFFPELCVCSPVMAAESFCLNASSVPRSLSTCFFFLSFFLVTQQPTTVNRMSYEQHSCHPILSYKLSIQHCETAAIPDFFTPVIRSSNRFTFRLMILIKCNDMSLK